MCVLYFILTFPGLKPFFGHPLIDPHQIRAKVQWEIQDS